MKRIFIVWLLATIITSFTGLTDCASVESRATTDVVPAPGFSLKNLDGNNVSLSDFRGKAVLINFWATTCPPCVEEMPNLQSLYSDWIERGDRVLLTIDLGEDVNTLQGFVAKNHYSLPVLLDGDYQVAEKYGIQYTPTTILIDKNGNMLFRVVGAFPDKASIVNKVRTYLPD